MVNPLNGSKEILSTYLRILRQCPSGVTDPTVWGGGLYSEHFMYIDRD